MKELTQDTKCNTETIKIHLFTKTRIVKNLLVVSFAFLIGATSHEGLNFLQSTMNKEVGVLGFAVQYVCGCITALFLPKYLIRRFGSKRVIVVSMFATVPYLASNFYPVYGFVIPTSILVGFATSFNSLCTYLNDLSSLYANICMKSEFQNLNLDFPQEEKNSNVKEVQVLPRNSYGSLGGKTVPIIDNSNSNSISGNIKSGFQMPLEELSSSILALSTEIKVLETKRIFESEICLLSTISDISLETCSEEKIESRSKEDEHRNSISEISSYSDLSTKLIETTTSRFFGIFGCIYQFSHMLCNVIAYAIFQNTSARREYIHNSSCVCGAEFCSIEQACFLHDVQLPSTETRYTLTTVYVVIDFLAALLILVFLDDLNEKNSEVSFSMEMAIMTIKLHKNKNQLLLVPLSIYVGMTQAFLTGDFTKDFIGCAWGVEHVSLVMISAGCALSFFSGLYALLEKHIGRYLFFSVAATLNLVVNIAMLYWTPDASYPTMMYLVAFILGAILGIWWCQVRAFIGLIFKEEEETAFGCYQLWHAVGCVIVYTYNNYICTYVKIYIMLTVSSLSVVCYLLAERNYAIKKRQFNKT